MAKKMGCSPVYDCNALVIALSSSVIKKAAMFSNTTQPPPPPVKPGEVEDNGGGGDREGPSSISLFPGYLSFLYSSEPIGNPLNSFDARDVIKRNLAFLAPHQ